MIGVILIQLDDCHCGDWFLMSLLMYFQHQPFIPLARTRHPRGPADLTGGAGRVRGTWAAWGGTLEKRVQGILRRMIKSWTCQLDHRFIRCLVVWVLPASLHRAGFVCCPASGLFSSPTLFLLCPSPLIECFRQSWAKRFYSKLIFLAAKLGSIKEKGE